MVSEKTISTYRGKIFGFYDRYHTIYVEILAAIQKGGTLTPRRQKELAAQFGINSRLVDHIQCVMRTLYRLGDQMSPPQRYNANRNPKTEPKPKKTNIKIRSQRLARRNGIPVGEEEDLEANTNSIEMLDVEQDVEEPVRYSFLSPPRDHEDEFGFESWASPFPMDDPSQPSTSGPVRPHIRREEFEEENGASFKRHAQNGDEPSTSGLTVPNQVHGAVEERSDSSRLSTPVEAHDYRQPSTSGPATPVTRHRLGDSENRIQSSNQKWADFLFQYEDPSQPSTSGPVRSHLGLGKFEEDGPSGHADDRQPSTSRPTVPNHRQENLENIIQSRNQEWVDFLLQYQAPSQPSTSGPVRSHLGLGEFEEDEPSGHADDRQPSTSRPTVPNHRHGDLANRKRDWSSIQRPATEVETQDRVQPSISEPVILNRLPPHAASSRLFEAERAGEQNSDILFGLDNDSHEEDAVVYLAFKLRDINIELDILRHITDQFDDLHVTIMSDSLKCDMATVLRLVHPLKPSCQTIVIRNTCPYEEIKRSIGHLREILAGISDMDVKLLSMTIEFDLYMLLEPQERQRRAQGAQKAQEWLDAEHDLASGIIELITLS